MKNAHIAEIDEAFTAVKAALKNAENEWRTSGDTMALKAFVGTVAFTTERLAGVLGEILPDLKAHIPIKQLSEITRVASELNHVCQELQRQMARQEVSK